MRTLADPELQARLAAVRLLILDVDGVMTDGGIVLGDGGESKRFDVRDGSGIKYLQRNGIEVALVSGRGSRAVQSRAEELGIEEVHQRALRKWPVVEEMLERKGVALGEVAYLGDDLVDLPVMVRVGLSVAVADACAEVLDEADAVTRQAGGHGAVRELAEAVLRARGKWGDIVAGYRRVEAPGGGVAS